jgi:mono/diheme cytochrome c family protein
MRALIATLLCYVFAAPSVIAQTRGELLYTTHCVSCHSTEIHWRDKSTVNGWSALIDQVRRWQDAASLAWSETDILEVSRYLNDDLYQFEQPAEPGSPSNFGAK